MRAVREFKVVPAIPEALTALTELATNVHWTWDRETQALFERLDPAEWARTGRDPLRLIAAITAERWDRLAADPSIVDATRLAADRLHDAIGSPRWFQG